MARAVASGVLERFPDEPIEVLIVWIDVIASDGPEGALRASSTFEDARVRQFHDSARRAGRAFAPLIGMPAAATLGGGEDWASAFNHDFAHGEPAVFDTVFFFAAGTTWSSKAPLPTSWVTQLDPQVWTGIDPERYRYGAELESELTRVTAELLGS